MTKYGQKHVCFFFSNACSIFRAHALQSELRKVSISKFVKFELQSMSLKIERVFEEEKNKKTSN